MLKLAVLIDADNAKPRLIGPILAEIDKVGTAFVKRAYGDWTGTGLQGWKNTLLSNSIQPIQQFAYTRGKNSTDAAMVIDAMDLLYTNRFDGFCLISSDSDFTRLASRIRESGLLVYGFGDQRTPAALVSACNKFFNVDDLLPNVAASDSEPSEATNAAAVATTTTHAPSQPAPTDNLTLSAARGLISKAMNNMADDEGWTELSIVGDIVGKLRPDFNPRNFGYKRLSSMIKADTSLETRRVASAGSNGSVVYLREKLKPRATTEAKGNKPGNGEPTLRQTPRRAAAENARGKITKSLETPSCLPLNTVQENSRKRKARCSDGEADAGAEQKALIKVEEEPAGRSPSGPKTKKVKREQGSQPEKKSKRSAAATKKLDKTKEKQSSTPSKGTQRKTRNKKQNI